MKIQNVALGALVLSVVLVGGTARAQDDSGPDAADGADGIPEPPESDEKDPDEKADPPAQTEAAGSAKLDVGAANATAEAETSAVGGVDDRTGTPRRPPVFGKRDDWSITPYGYARFDAIADSTQSFEDGMQPNLIARAGTYRGDHQRSNFTARDSRIGLFVGAPTFEGMRSYAQLELDFFGLVPTDAKKHDATVFGPVRIRHAFFKLETPVIDLLAGQYWDVFGWGSQFFPATVAFLGVPGQVYHRDPQLRLEKALHFGQLEIKAALAAVRAGQRDSGIPDAQAGLKFAFDGWTGAAMSGLGNPSIAPVSLGVSGVYRRFQVPVFRPEPGSEHAEQSGYGFVTQLLLPIIPAKNDQDRNNALTATGEFSIGTGIADMYTGMDGGSRFPLLPNPASQSPAPAYDQNIDNGLVTFDRNYQLQTLDWRGFVVGLQYYLPIDSGRVWISGLYSQAESDNIQELTPIPSRAAVYSKMEYMDASAGVFITPALVLGLSFQTAKQTFADVSAPDPIWGVTAPPGAPVGSATQPGTGGEPASARNNRGQLSAMFIF